jgi:hypothetical protein
VIATHERAVLHNPFVQQRAQMRTAALEGPQSVFGFYEDDVVIGRHESKRAKADEGAGSTYFL